MAMLDIIDEIMVDHNNVRDLLERFKREKDHDQKCAIGATLCHEMSVHGDAEEMSVYTHFREYGLGDVVKQNEKEHDEVKKMVCDAQNTHQSDADYDKIMCKAAKIFLNHCHEEENDQLKKLKDGISSKDSDQMAKDFLDARKKAPACGEVTVPLKYMHGRPM